MNEPRAKNPFVNRGIDPAVPLVQDRRNVTTVRPVAKQEVLQPSHPVKQMPRQMYFYREDDKTYVLQAQPSRDYGVTTRFVVETIEPMMSRGKLWPAGTKFECSITDKDDFVLSRKAKVLFEIRK